MYTSFRTRPDASQHGSSRKGAFNSTVLFLGLTSFFMDISAEMVTAVVPLFLTASLGLSPSGFGLFSAANEIARASLPIVGGAAADRTQRPKETAAAGYGISALSRAGLAGSALFGLWAIPFLLIDRLGKGLRTGPRDAMISLATPKESWGAAFGIHRTMDASGALLGPIVAGLILWQLPGSFDSVFVVSLAFGLIGFAIISIAVRNPKTVRRTAPTTVRKSLLVHWSVPGFRRIAAIAVGLGLFTVGDGFLYLVIADFAQEGEGIGINEVARWFAYLSAGTALVFLLTATPLGRIADRVGRGRMWVAGHLLLAGAYVALLFHPTSALGVISVLILLGLYYGATDGMLPALIAGVVSAETRSGGIAVINTVQAGARAVSALAFGLIWTQFGADRGLLIAGVGLLVIVAISAVIAVLRPENPVRHA